MPFPAFSAGHFQEINTKENAVISCLIYFSLRAKLCNTNSAVQFVSNPV